MNAGKLFANDGKTFTARPLRIAEQMRGFAKAERLIENHAQADAFELAASEIERLYNAANDISKKAFSYLEELKSKEPA